MISIFIRYSLYRQKQIFFEKLSFYGCILIFISYNTYLDTIKYYRFEIDIFKKELSPMKTLRFELDGSGLRVYLSPEGEVFVDAGDYIGRYHGGNAAEEVSGEYLKDYPASRRIRGRAVWTEETFFHVLWDDAAPDEFGFDYLEKAIPAIREEIARLRSCEIKNS